jgi:hypothetical protein
MRTLSLVLLAALLAVPAIVLGHSKHYQSSTSHRHCVSVSTGLFEDDSRSIDFKGKKVVIRYDGDTPRRAEINERHELRVDDNLIVLNTDQQRLVGEFYDKTRQLVTEAKAIGLEGAAIGVHGIEVAATALTGVVNMLFTSYTSDDLERDVERKAAKIEARASKLEAKANDLEELADQLQDLYDEMEDTIPELRGDI